MAVRERQRLLTTATVFLIAFTVIIGAISQSIPAAVERTLSVTASYLYLNNGLSNEAATIYAYKSDGSWAAIRHNNTAGYFDISTDDGSTWNRILLNIVEDVTPQLGGELDAQDNPITDIDYLGFNLVNGRTPLEGEMAWNPEEGTLDVGMPGGTVVLQLGQEMLLYGKNATGAQIDDGQAVRISGASGSKPEFGLADANDPAAAGSIGLATEDIANNQNGFVNIGGLVRGLDTTGTPVSETWNAADRIYVSNTAGALTNVAPTGSERIIFIGIVLRAHATEGIICVKPINVSYLGELSGVTIAGEADDEVLRYDSGTGLWGNEAIIDDSHPPSLTTALSGKHAFDYLEFFNGTIEETVDIYIVEAAGIVSLELQKEGGGDLTANFSTGHHLIDTTDPVASVALTNGTDTVPVKNWVYILESNDTLTASAVGWPDVEHAPIARVVVQSAASVASVGAYAVQAWTDHIKDANDQGHQTDIADWIRGQHATWKSGVEPTLTIDTGPEPDTLTVTTTSGEVYQLHKKDFPAFTGTPTIYVYNDNAQPYKPITDLNQLDADSTGAAFTNNDYFAITLWGYVSEKEADSKLFWNLPSGVYGNSSALLQDHSNFANTNIPILYKGGAFLVKQYHIRFQTSGSGTFTLIREIDLRGQPPGTMTGGGAGAGSALTIEEVDASPSIADVNTMKFPNGSVTDEGGGIVSISIGAEFASNVFRILDVTDPTKKIAFNANSLTAGVTRSLIVPDVDGTLVVSGMSDAVDLGGATLELPNSVGNGTLVNPGQIHIDLAEDAIALHLGTGGVIPGEAQISAFVTIDVPMDPGTQYAIDTDARLIELGLEAPNGFKIIRWSVDFGMDPDVELDADLCYADDWAETNEVVIDDISTTNGTSSETVIANINGGVAIPTGKRIYIRINADPEGTGDQMSFRMQGYAEED